MWYDCDALPGERQVCEVRQVPDGPPGDVLGRCPDTRVPIPPPCRTRLVRE